MRIMITGGAGFVGSHLALSFKRDLPHVATETRFVIPEANTGPGWSARGITENFALIGSRSLYGATKLCSELIIAEYGALHGLPAVINRCGVVTGPWQMGKVDQG